MFRLTFWSACYLSRWIGLTYWNQMISCGSIGFIPFFKTEPIHSRCENKTFHSPFPSRAAHRRAYCMSSLIWDLVVEVRLGSFVWCGVFQTLFCNLSIILLIIIYWKANIFELNPTCVHTVYVDKFYGWIIWSVFGWGSSPLDCKRGVWKVPLPPGFTD